MGKRLRSKGFQEVQNKDQKNLKMKLYYVQNFNTEILLRFLVVAFKEKRECLSMNICPTKA
jgi:hypothetical protein